MAHENDTMDLWDREANKAILRRVREHAELTATLPDVCTGCGEGLIINGECVGGAC